MADLEEEIRKRSSGPFSVFERQAARFFMERDFTKERFLRGMFRWIAYLAPAAGLAVGLTQLYRMFF